VVRVKICGITTAADARAALDLGANAVGLVFAESPRQVIIAEAAKVSKAVGPWISVVGVFVDEAPSRILKIARECGLSAAQLHGHEPAADMAGLKGLKVIKAFHVDADYRAGILKSYAGADAFLFDSKIAGQFGGTGRTFDWNLLKKSSAGKPVIVSGGLHPGNAAKAVRFFKPYGVDVSSGVEKSPGKKDLKLMKEFIRNAKKIEY